MTAYMIALIAVASVTSYAFASDNPVKKLKAGEIYKFEDQFDGGKKLSAEVKCLAEGVIDQGDLNCGHTKHCTVMKAGEIGQTSHMKFECTGR